MRIGTLFGLSLLGAGSVFCGLAGLRLWADVADLNRQHLAIGLIDTYRDVLSVAELLAVERGGLAVALASKDGITDADIESVRRRGRAVDEAVDAARRSAQGLGIADPSAIIRGISDVQHADHLVREAVAAQIVYPPTDRASTAIRHLTEMMFSAEQGVDGLLSILDQQAGAIRPATAQVLVLVRLAADLREAASRMVISPLPAEVDGRPFTPEELGDIGRAVGQYEYLRRRIDTAVAAGGPAVAVAAAWSRALRDFVNQGMVWINDIYVAGRADGRFPVSVEAQMARVQPTLQSLLELRNVAIDAVRSDTQAEIETIEQRVLVEVSVGFVLLLVLAAIALALRGRLVRPSIVLSAAIVELAEGRRNQAIPYGNRDDEIGDIARAVGELRRNAIEVERLAERTRKWEQESYEQAVKAREEAARANHNKSWFLANMSHELRTPLNAIIGFAELMHKELFGPLDARYRNYAGDILRSGVHLLSLVNRILDLSKIEAGAFKVKEAPVLVADAINHCAALVSLNAKAMGITLSVRVEPALPAIRGDLTIIRQIITNLLSNAVKFTERGGRVDLTAERTKEGGLRLTVADTGIGMNDAELELALLPFGRPETALSREREGTGLGLPLAKQLTEALGALFSITSQPGKGTVVLLTFPRARLVIEPPVTVERGWARDDVPPPPGEEGDGDVGSPSSSGETTRQSSPSSEV